MKKKNTLLNSLINKNNITLTENGAPTYKSTLNAVLDLFAMGAALRTRQVNEKVSLFSKAFAEDPLLAMKCLFNIRNVRGGAGERQTFKDIIKYLAINTPSILEKNLSNVTKFGRWDDLFVLFETPCEQAMLAYIADQYQTDLTALEKNTSVSLLAKWLPSINTSSNDSVQMAYKFAKYFNQSAKVYRKSLSALRSKLKVVEKEMSAKKWDKINYEIVPSKAQLIYKNAFEKHDPVRYQKYIAEVTAGTKKINASALFPYEIYDKCKGGANPQVLDALWNALPNYLEKNDDNLIVVADVSPSMNGRPMSVSVSLAIYIAERNKGAFKDYFLTFSSNPQLQKVVGSNISDKIRNLERADWGGSTNLQATFDLILNHAVNTKTPAKEMPSQIIIVSDMEFNYACGGTTNLEAIKAKYAAAGYKMPNLVFWNVDSRQNNVPAKADEKGVLLVSGASPSVFKTLMTGVQCTPADQMLETLNQPMYDSVVV